MKPFLGLSSAVWLALAGIAFTARCEIGPPVPGGWPTCWVMGGAIAGVPFAKKIAEKSGFVEGYNTYNPALHRRSRPVRKPEEDSSEPTA